ncbi:MAG TPA: patatin-like phospholipase family protein [Candidatus Binatia bacterium]|nr:patatin-like phospholipase family protein [Candidatus Binatia bacterium]
MTRRPQRAAHAPRALLVCVLSFVTGCAYPVRNRPATIISDTHGYQFAKREPSAAKDTLVIVTLSGGGTRAAALGLSVLRGLDKIALPDGETLATEVDVISSVSGGSVTAAFFALAGRDGFKRLEADFIRKNGMAPLLFGFFNPVGLVRFAMPGQERIDLLIDYLNKQLFDGKTYQALIEQKHRPFLILNAADMVEGVPFPFTQRKMDLLCSDLSQMPLATAVAASAAFPVALSPVTLKNYSPCAAHKDPWPPLWVSVNIDEPGTPPKDSLWYDNPPRATLGRTEYAYALGNDPGRTQRKLYIHLLDGGIADNLGIFEPNRMLTTRDTLPTFLGQIDTGKIKKLIFVMVNARSFAPSDLDENQATPGILDMLLASISSPIDRATTGTANQLRQLLFDEFRQLALADPKKEAVYHALAGNTALISVDFDAIVDEDCRRKYHSIPTSWSLKAKQVDAVLVMGQALLASDPEFADLLKLTGGTITAPLPSVGEACKLL